MWVFLWRIVFQNDAEHTMSVFGKKLWNSREMGSWAFLKASWEFDSCRWVCPCLGLAGLSPGAAEATRKGQGRQCPVFSVHSKTRHTLHSSLVASCPARAKESSRPKDDGLTWSVSFFSRAWRRLRASSNWPPSCWLANPLIRPPVAATVKDPIRQKYSLYSPSILSSLLVVAWT